MPARPFVRSIDAIRRDYGLALDELHLSEWHEGMAYVESLAVTAERGHNYAVTTPHLHESIHAFEAILETMLEIAALPGGEGTRGVLPTEEVQVGQGDGV